MRKVLLPVVDLGLDDPDVRKTFCEMFESKSCNILPCPYEKGDKLPIGEIVQLEAVPSGPAQKHKNPNTKLHKSAKRRRTEVGDKDDEIQSEEVGNTEIQSDGNSEKKVQSDQTSRTKALTLRDRGYTPPATTRNMYSSRTCTLPKEIYGHTGFLTFATYCA